MAGTNQPIEITIDDAEIRRVLQKLLGRGRIPARPFLGISAQDRVAILDILRDHIKRALNP